MTYIGQEKQCNFHLYLLKFPPLPSHWSLWLPCKSNSSKVTNTPCIESMWSNPNPTQELTPGLSCSIYPSIKLQLFQFHLIRSSWKTPSQNHPVDSFPNSWSWDNKLKKIMIIAILSSKSDMICYTVISTMKQWILAIRFFEFFW
jgi:hypothetical protein